MIILFLPYTKTNTFSFFRHPFFWYLFNDFSIRKITAFYFFLFISGNISFSTFFFLR